MGSLKNKTDYSKYKCPYSHIKKDCGHELHGPEDYEDAYSVWCNCGFHAPVFCLDPDELRLEKIDPQSLECVNLGNNHKQTKSVF